MSPPPFDPQEGVAHPWLQASAADWLRHVLEIHFDPANGAPYWLERQQELGIDVRKEIRRPEDLLRFGPMQESDLTTRPLTDFLPRHVLARKDKWVVVETGGTLGHPKTTLYLEREFRGIFVDYFTHVARANGFPEGVNWLFAGPTGPHVIGKAARANALALGAPDPFAIDFDPRWAKRLLPGSLGQQRYLQHITEQCLHILRTQDVRVLFTTPAVLKVLARELEEELRRRIEGVFYGGMPISAGDYRLLHRDAFPNAVHLSGYGNTLLGLALQQRPTKNADFDYYYPGVRLLPRLVELADNGSRQHQGWMQEVADGQTGRLVVSRLDESFLILNLRERDQAVRLPAPSTGTDFPLLTPGLRNPEPTTRTQQRAAGGFY